MANSQIVSELPVKGLVFPSTDKLPVSSENRMADSEIVSELQVEGFRFPSTVKPPGSSKSLILGGAGARGLEIQGKFVKFTAIAVYVEREAIPLLAVKWKGKTADELTDSVEFFRDVIKGPFEKFTRVTMILPLTGQQYAEKATENCVNYWKSVGIYTEAEAIAVEKFREAFKEVNFPHGASILFTYSPSGTLTIGLSKDDSISEEGKVVIENKALSEAFLESIIGEHGISPEAKRCLAVRVSQLLKEFDAEKLPTDRECEVKGQGDNVIVK